MDKPTYEPFGRHVSFAPSSVNDHKMWNVLIGHSTVNSALRRDAQHQAVAARTGLTVHACHREVACDALSDIELAPRLQLEMYFHKDTRAFAAYREVVRSS